MTVIPRVLAFLTLLFSFSVLAIQYSCAQATSTRIDVGSTVIRSDVKPFGINLGELTFYDSGQMMKNLVFRNPGFEGMVYRSVMRCASGSAQSCVDEQSSTAWPDGFWNKARYEIIWGAAKGRSGVISSFRQNPTTYFFTEIGPAPAAGDYIVLTKEFDGGATDGWWTSIAGSGAISTETSDLPPDTAGRQCLRLQAMAAGSEAAIHSYFDSTSGMTFLRLNGTYSLSFQARGVAGARQIRVDVKRGSAQYLNSVLTLSSGWSHYSLRFDAAESGAPLGTAQLSLAAAGGSEILVDDISLEQADSNVTNTTAFRDPVVNALKELKPGILRNWAGQLGDTFENQTSAAFARRRTGYSAYSKKKENLICDLHEFLQLCASVGAEPWYVVPITFSPEEAAALIEYLSGSVMTPEGARRAARGRSLPWTKAFPKIHLEFGNESWNSLFKGGAIEWPAPYGNRAAEIFAAMRQSPYFVPAKFNLVLGGQAVYIDRNRQIVGASTGFDSLSLAPYLMNDVNSFDTNEELFGPLFAEPQQITHSGYMREDFDMLRVMAPEAKLSVYEVNLHTLGGTITQDRLDAFVPSLGAGVAVAEHMLLMLRDLGATDQMLFKLPQYRHIRPDGKEVRLWGSVVDMGVSDRRRPVFLALQLINEALSGDMLKTTHSGSDPLWNQPPINGVQPESARYLLSFAFQSGTTTKLVLLNLHRLDTLPVTFGGTNGPRGNVVLKRLSAPDITAHNEISTNVSIATEVKRFNGATTLSLPPHSISVLFWDVKR